MSYQADGQPEQVASCLLNAVTWWAKQGKLAADSVLTLERLRTEAEILISSSNPNPSSPEPDKETADKETADKETGAASQVPSTD